MNKVYGVAIYRDRGDKPAMEALQVQAETADEAISAVLIRREAVSRIYTLALGYQETSEYCERFAGWLLDMHSEYQVHRVEGPIGNFLQREQQR